MSNDWNVYPSRTEDMFASVLYDHGVSTEIDEIAPPNLLRIRLSFKHADDWGMPNESEESSLNAFEDEVQLSAEESQSLFVGRVSVDGHRHFYVYTGDTEGWWEDRVAKLGKKHAYEVAFAFEPDEERSGYWNDLFPSPEEWQLIQDMQLLRMLEENGDDGSIPRRVEHWAYFPTLEIAERFAELLRERNYESIECETTDDDRASVRFAHVGSIDLSEISAHTISLLRAASEMEGEYDGWETPVCRAE